jgi:hypothetical protein
VSNTNDGVPTMQHTMFGCFEGWRAISHRESTLKSSLIKRSISVVEVCRRIGGMAEVRIAVVASKTLNICTVVP